jgi:hypothetical protein
VTDNVPMSIATLTKEAVPTTTQRSVRPRWLKPAIWIAAVVVALVAAFFVADAIVRASAQSQVAQQIRQQLPRSVTAKDLSVSIGGFSIIGQYLSGSFDEVKLRADHVALNGIPATVRVVGHGIPTDLTKPVDSITGSLSISENAVNRLITIPGATSTLSFGRDTIGYSGSADVFGIPISFKAVAAPIANGLDILLTPKSVQVTGGPAQLDLGAVVTQLIGDKPFPLCVAQYLPNGATVTGIAVKPNSAVVTISAADIVLDEKTFTTHAHCS